MMPSYLSYLARAHAELGHFDDATRCIGEAITTMETTKERWFEAEVNRIAGEIALLLPEPDVAKAEANRACRASPAGVVMRQSGGTFHLVDDRIRAVRAGLGLIAAVAGFKTPGVTAPPFVNRGPPAFFACALAGRALARDSVHRSAATASPQRARHPA